MGPFYYFCLTIYFKQKKSLHQNMLPILLSILIVGLISVPFLIKFFFKSQTKIRKIYVLGGYLIVVPWVYIVLIYFSSLISPIIITIFASLIPVLGSYLGYKFGKD